MDEPRTISMTEAKPIPWTSLFFGGIAMVPFVVGAALTVWIGGDLGALFATATVLWGASILTFLAGVRRGVSFRTAQGPTASQLVVMMWLYLLGLGALFVSAFAIGTPSVPALGIAALLLAAGYASMIVLDPVAAREGEAPLHFIRLRPVQLLFPTASLIAIAVWSLNAAL